MKRSTLAACGVAVVLLLLAYALLAAWLIHAP